MERARNMKTIDEVLEVISQILIRCTIIGFVMLFYWWGALELCGDFVYCVHSKMAPMSRTQFEIIHYVGILTVKTAVLMLFFFPYIAIRFVIRKRKKQLSNQAVEATP